MVGQGLSGFPSWTTGLPSCPIAATTRHSNLVDVCALSKLPLGGIGSKCAAKTREKEKECIYTMDHGYQNWPFSKCLPPNFHHFANIHLRSIPSLKYTNFIRSKPANHRSQVVTFRKKWRRAYSPAQASSWICVKETVLGKKWLVKKHLPTKSCGENSWWETHPMGSKSINLHQLNKQNTVTLESVHQHIFLQYPIPK